MSLTIVSGETATRLPGVSDAWVVSSWRRHWVVRPHVPIAELDLQDFSHPARWTLLACTTYVHPFDNPDSPGWYSEVVGDPDGSKHHVRQKEALAVMRADTLRIHGLCATKENS